ncbi:hypothetical protein ZIOFF_041643 [Zingiber officinale]|uniref:Uncharacterized protein n=1 Tax=Zingiber officinale TaxID=94328 RepID=A0A8J5L620_ZINOF|nr:hypothetical protein ZIOFF_041643 [Zingiber officinale]
MAGFYRDDFRNYAETCFRNFGDRVKHWITFNEPWSYSIGGYGLGFLAPGRCSNWEEQRCSNGDSSKEPYIVAHHQLLAHAAAVLVYKRKYQKLSMNMVRAVEAAWGWAIHVRNDGGRVWRRNGKSAEAMSLRKVEVANLFYSMQHEGPKGSRPNGYNSMSLDDILQARKKTDNCGRIVATENLGSVSPSPDFASALDL